MKHVKNVHPGPPCEYYELTAHLLKTKKTKIPPTNTLACTKERWKLHHLLLFRNDSKLNIFFDFSISFCCRIGREFNKRRTECWRSNCRPFKHSNHPAARSRIGRWNKVSSLQSHQFSAFTMTHPTIPAIHTHLTLPLTQVLLLL